MKTKVLEKSKTTKIIKKEIKHIPLIKRPTTV